LKKHILAILLCIVLGGFSGIFTWYQIQKIYIKKQVTEHIERGIDEESLVLLRFSYAELKSKLRWEHSKEFEYNQQMYDIVRAEYGKDSVSFWCWHDKEETRINQKINHIAKLVFPNNTKENKYNRTSNTDFLKNLYYSSDNCTLYIYNFYKLTFNFPDINYCSIVFSPLTPPPK